MVIIPLNLRDFIYLDIERLKSIIAQYEEGLIDSTKVTIKDTAEVSADGGLKIPALLNVAGGTKYIWENQAYVARTLHDYIYNKVEDVLINENLLICIPEDITVEELAKIEMQDILKDNSFVLIRGKVKINDMEQILKLLNNLNNLVEFFTRLKVSGSVTADISKNAKEKLDKEISKIAKPSMLDEDVVKGFKLFFNSFYGERIIIKISPYDNFDNRFVGILKEDCLREKISDIIFKYGTAPSSEWIILAQISSIPKKDRPKDNPIKSGNAVDIASEGIFTILRELEISTGQSVNYPDIAITPIAIYRE